MKIDGSRRNDRATELVLSWYAAFNRGDWNGMLALLSDDVIHDRNQGPRELGREAFANYLQHRAMSYREQLQSIVVMVSPDGTRAAAEFTVQGAYVQDDAGLPPARGQRYTLHAGTFFNIHAGQLRRVSEYANLQELIAQVAIG